MYKIDVPVDCIRDLWVLKQFHAEGPICGQVKIAVKNYLEDKRKEIGCDIKEIQEPIERHAREEAETKLSANEL